jgi:uncharacterized protein YndB with AHSA1/START domain
MSSIPEKEARSASRSPTTSPARSAKTNAHTDTHHGRLAKLVPDEQIVETTEFETDDPALKGEMTIRVSLIDAEGGGTDILAVHEGLPSSPAEPPARRWPPGS